jgi:hypothetical protein
MERAARIQKDMGIMVIKAKALGQILAIMARGIMESQIIRVMTTTVRIPSLRKVTATMANTETMVRAITGIKANRVSLLRTQPFLLTL